MVRTDFDADKTTGSGTKSGYILDIIVNINRW